MAFVATASTAEPRSYSVGPLKVQHMTWAVASADVAGTITADRLSQVLFVQLSGGLSLTSAPTISGNVVTLAFADPAATIVGSVICYGR